MKRWKVWVAVSALSMAVAAGPGAAYADEMTMAKPDYGKVDVMMKDGMDWVPLRQVAESLGYTVAWHEADRSITLSMPKMGMGDGMTDKSMTDNGMIDKDMTDKGMTDKGMADKGMTDKGMTDKSMTDKSMTDKGMAEMQGAYVVTIQIGSMKASIAGKETDLTFAPVIMTDKTYVTKSFVDSVLVTSMMK